MVLKVYNAAKVLFGELRCTQGRHPAHIPRQGDEALLGDTALEGVANPGTS